MSDDKYSNIAGYCPECSKEVPFDETEAVGPEKLNVNDEDIVHIGCNESLWLRPKVVERLITDAVALNGIDGIAEGEHDIKKLWSSIKR